MDREYNEAHGSKGSDGGKAVAGCTIGCLVMLLVVGVVIFLALRSVQGLVDDLAEKSTTTERVEFAYPEVQPNEVNEVIDRFDKFRVALSKDEIPEPLVLSEDDINTLINNHSTFQDIAGKMMIDLADDQIMADFSLNLDELNIEFPFVFKALAGRYINGKAKIDIEIIDNQAELYILDFEIGEMSLPKQYMEQLGGENLLSPRRGDVELNDFIEKLKELKIEDNKLHVIPKLEQEVEKPAQEEVFAVI